MAKKKPTMEENPTSGKEGGNNINNLDSVQGGALLAEGGETAAGASEDAPAVPPTGLNAPGVVDGSVYLPEPEIMPASGNIANELDNAAPVARPDIMETMNDSETGAARDSAGQLFDPLIHVAKADGTPSKTKLGKFIRRAQKMVDRDRDRANWKGVAEQAPEPQQSAEAAKMYGASLATAFFAVGNIALGEDWAPEAGEHKAIEQACIAYCASRPDAPVTPGTALALAMGAFTLTRVTRPTVKARLINAYVVVKGWFQK